ncbi:hypothetical protein ElyMa_005454300 [Elysia marginata]|uniref:Uncharacterized protein n=1 Tax=Elysia marginata TaxID=1093978 RepID=A0AAV4ENU5_9GAST|nr:hypothetical protein ElyMa_005454300 [Elysia marginata]
MPCPFEGSTVGIAQRRIDREQISDGRQSSRNAEGCQIIVYFKIFYKPKLRLQAAPHALDKLSGRRVGHVNASFWANAMPFLVHSRFLIVL